MRHDLAGGGAPSACGAGSPTASADDEAYAFAFTPAGQIAARTAANDNAPYTGFAPLAAQTDTYAHDLLNRTTSAGSLTPAYADGRGNMTSDGVATYEYDFDNRLTKATVGSVSYALTYDPLGRLHAIAEVGGGAAATTRFLYDGVALIAEYDRAEYDGNDALKRRYVHGAMGPDKPIAWSEGLFGRGAPNGGIGDA